MKLKNLSQKELEESRKNADEEIIRLKRGGSPEEGPLLPALRSRRAELIAELDRRAHLLVTA